ncbi:MAG: mechanosensitive ion channel [Deltaproteobacteria bacterium]|nr:mechanosensitive ion channel [Deltaproteobacteria bacterium]
MSTHGPKYRDITGMKLHFILVILFTALQLMLSPSGCIAANKAAPAKSQLSVPEKSPVTLNDKELFAVRGIGSITSEMRANLISARIKKSAEDLTIRTDSIKVVDADISTDVVTGDMTLISVLDRDTLETGRTRQELAREYAETIRSSIESYRADYSRESILYAAGYSVVAAIIGLLLIFLINRLFRKLNILIDTRYKDKLRSIQIKSLEIVQVDRVRAFVHGTARIIHFALMLILLYAFFNFTLGLFPWTRPLAGRILSFVLDPLQVMAAGILKEIPQLLFIVVLVFVTRFALKIMRLLFDHIEQETITFSGFYPEWAKPTYRILRFLAIAFAAVVAFPYVPGSDSPAFKGVSIFIGVLFSLGSQSTVSNILAGFTMTYRRLFKVGDRVRIDDILGDVTRIRLQVTHLMTIKNEEVIVPNSTILNSNVTNFSSLVTEKPLILHTSITIGYDTPWRQVHALLLMAAERTPGLLREPAPFVLQKSLDDFYVTYELNVSTDTPHTMSKLYSGLHQNIQDCFNEYGVQIMSPNYEADREVPTFVPKERWFAAPADEAEDTMRR